MDLAYRADADALRRGEVASLTRELARTAEEAGAVRMTKTGEIVGTQALMVSGPRNPPARWSPRLLAKGISASARATKIHLTGDRGYSANLTFVARGQGCSSGHLKDFRTVPE